MEFISPPNMGTILPCSQRPTLLGNMITFVYIDTVRFSSTTTFDMLRSRPWRRLAVAWKALASRRVGLLAWASRRAGLLAWPSSTSYAPAMPQSSPSARLSVKPNGPRRCSPCGLGSRNGFSDHVILPNTSGTVSSEDTVFLPSTLPQASAFARPAVVLRPISPTPIMFILESIGMHLLQIILSWPPCSLSWLKRRGVCD